MEIRLTYHSSIKENMLKLERMEMKQLRCVGYKKRVWKQELNTDF